MSDQQPEIKPGPGKVEIYDEVIKTLSGLAATKVDGIFGLKGGFIEGIKQVTTGRRDYTAGVEVKRDPAGNFALDMHVIIRYDFKIADVAAVVQDAVKAKVESVTGRKVTAVNIHVVDIRLPEDVQEIDG